MARRAARSDWGCVQEVGRGRWRIRYWAETPDGYRRCSETVRGTRRDAYDRLAQIRLEHSRDAPCPTVGQAWSQWVLPSFERRVMSGDISVGTLEHYRMAWRVHVFPTWGSTPAREVTASGMQAWLDAMTRGQADMARIVMRAIFDELELRGVCDAAVLHRRYRMPPAGETRDRGIWSLDELGAIWGASRGTYLEPWLILSAFGGPRVGESLGVRNAEVALTRPHGVPVAVVPIVRQATRDGDVTGRLKTAQSVHAAVVPGPLAERLHGLCLASEDEWILQAADGRPMRREAVRERFDRLLAKADVPRHPMRNLRNSWETYTHWVLCVDPEKIERMMGHVGRSVTERHYDRPEADALADAVARAYLAHPFQDGWDELGRE
jgi:hypothetical protein